MFFVTLASPNLLALGKAKKIKLSLDFSLAFCNFVVEKINEL